VISTSIVIVGTLGVPDRVHLQCDTIQRLHK